MNKTTRYLFPELTATSDTWTCYRIWFRDQCATMRSIEPGHRLAHSLTPYQLNHIDCIDSLTQETTQ